MLLVHFYKNGKVTVKRYKNFKDYCKKAKKGTVAKSKNGGKV